MSLNFQIIDGGASVVSFSVNAAGASALLVNAVSISAGSVLTAATSSFPNSNFLLIEVGLRILLKHLLRINLFSRHQHPCLLFRH